MNLSEKANQIKMTTKGKLELAKLTLVKLGCDDPGEALRCIRLGDCEGSNDVIDAVTDYLTDWEDSQEQNEY